MFLLMPEVKIKIQVWTQPKREVKVSSRAQPKTKYKVLPPPSFFFFYFGLDCLYLRDFKTSSLSCLHICDAFFSFC